ncbi:hypothetical protein PENANT_c029G05539 [Penicillium antarcticum]|uniref:ATP-grasp domain-containing protein n=1 Tax=Penicillium antarcticum TaxID=416450 RepID=A0A1V6PVR6_9EURO|nr:uncharacterized protein N7508_001589 [Penicillium antarcticum]KAJ5317081.1 hypothetical protein N7508_001589 [Penicillium antarcticum]OQD81098.1 hypothetical protein PENANT_c029G05539 [Penicillium antarcticum]
MHQQPVIDQPPGLVEKFDDELYLNDRLRSMGNAFTLPKSWEVKATNDPDSLYAFIKENIPTYPIVGKPVRGRGSHGVKATITAMSPYPESCGYWAMAPVMRFNHDNGIAPYNETVAVTDNSRVISNELADDPAYGMIIRQCERVASLIKATAPIRIDIRRFRPEAGEFAIFDVNMKPNMIGPGRPARKDQASSTAMAATACGWDYTRLLQEILKGASALETFRQYQSPFKYRLFTHCSRYIIALSKA